MHFEIGVVGVGLAGEQRLDLPAGRLGIGAPDRLLALGDRRLVTRGLAPLDQGRAGFAFAGEGAEFVGGGI